jgi:hypothetical protein
MSDSGIDVIRSVWMAEYEPLHVEPSADVPGSVRVLAKTKDAEDYWGKLDITLPAEMARLLAKALVACADEQEAA